MMGKTFSPKSKVLLITGLFLLSMIPVTASAADPPNTEYELGSVELRDTEGNYLTIDNETNPLNNPLKKGEKLHVSFDIKLKKTRDYIWGIVNPEGLDHKNYYTWTELTKISVGSCTVFQWCSATMELDWYFQDLWNLSLYAFGQGTYKISHLQISTSDKDHTANYLQAAISNPTFDVVVDNPTMFRVVLYDSSIATSLFDIDFFQDEFAEAESKFNVIGSTGMKFKNVFRQYQWTGSGTGTINHCTADGKELLDMVRAGFASVSTNGIWGYGVSTFYPDYGHTFETNRGFDYLFGITHRGCPFGTAMGKGWFDAGYHVLSEGGIVLDPFDWNAAIQHETAHALGQPDHTSSWFKVMKTGLFGYGQGYTAWTQDDLDKLEDTINGPTGLFPSTMNGPAFSRLPIDPRYSA